MVLAAHKIGAASALDWLSLDVGGETDILNELLLTLANWLDSQSYSTALHESFYMYNWVESTHVLTLMLFLGMLIIIDLRMLGWIFPSVPASQIAARLDKPLMLGMAVMFITGFALYYAIPVRTTQSLWFRIKVVLLVAAAVNALLFRARMQNSVDSWDTARKPPANIRYAAAASLTLWAGVVITGRTIAYDWFDCHKQMSDWMYWAAGCVSELAAQAETH